MSTLPEIHGNVLWLMPDQPAGIFFRKWIERLSRKFQSPVFAPHITLAKVPALPAVRLKSITEKTPSFHLLCGDIECRNTTPYQKLIVKISPSETLSSLHNLIDDKLGGSFSKKHDPHLSLLYGNLPCDLFEDLIPQIKQNLPGKIHVTHVSMMRLNGTPENWKEKYNLPLKD